MLQIEKAGQYCNPALLPENGAGNQLAGQYLSRDVKPVESEKQNRVSRSQYGGVVAHLPERV